MVKLLVINPNSSKELTRGLDNMINDLGYSEVCHFLDSLKSLDSPVAEMMPFNRMGTRRIALCFIRLDANAASPCW
jgi:hypothetical protein